MTIKKALGSAALLTIAALFHPSDCGSSHVTDAHHG